MESPFTFFREHQKRLLVFTFLAAMIAFVLGDPLMRLVGSLQGRGSSDPALVETSAGNLHRSDFEELANTRVLANNFMQLAAMESGVPEAAQFNFGSTNRDDLLFTWLFRQEGKRLGIQVDNGQVQEFLDKTFNRKLSTRRFIAACDQAGASQIRVFEALKAELMAQEAVRVSRPPLSPTPEQMWDYYQQVHQRQVIEVAAVPVAAFNDDKAEPDDNQVAQLFAQHKETFDPRETPDRPLRGKYKPGFREPRKVQLQYVKLGFEEAKAEVAKSNPVTDAEIEAYYEEKKLVDLSLQEPNAPAPEEPGDKPGLTLPDEEVEMIEGETPQEEGDRPPAPAKPDETTEPAPATDGDPAPESKATPPAEEAAPPKNEAEPETPAAPESGDKAPGAEPATSEPPSSACQEGGEAAAPEVKGVPDEAAPAQPAEEKPAAEAQPAGEEKPAAVEPPPADEPAGEAKEGETPEAGAKPKPPAPPPDEPRPTGPRFKPLDDELRAELRDRLIADRARVLLKKRSRQVANAMYTAGEKLAAGDADKESEELGRLTSRERDQREEARQAANVAAAGEALRAVATAHSGEFVETGLLSPQDLLEHPVLGKAQEAASDEGSLGGSNILTLSFRDTGVYVASELEDSPLSDLEGNRYVMWKVRNVSDHVPALDEPGVREHVVRTWRRLQAEPKAKARAEDLRAAAKGEQPLETALAGQKVNPAAGEPVDVTIAESADFSRYRQSSAPMSFRQRLELGNPGVVDGAGEEFMKAVFEEMQPGDVKVVPNDDASIYYVVKVKSRTPATREAFQQASLFGISIGTFNLPSQYQELANRDSQRVMLQFDRQLQKRYAVRLRDPETGAYLPDRLQEEDDVEVESDDAEA